LQMEIGQRRKLLRTCTVCKFFYCESRIIEASDICCSGPCLSVDSLQAHSSCCSSRFRGIDLYQIHFMSFPSVDIARNTLPGKLYPIYRWCVPPSPLPFFHCSVRGFLNFWDGRHLLLFAAHALPRANGSNRECGGDIKYPTSLAYEVSTPARSEGLGPQGSVWYSHSGSVAQGPTEPFRTSSGGTEETFSLPLKARHCGVKRHGENLLWIDRCLG
jgi:hypothetical protein